MFLGFRSRDLNNEADFIVEQSTVPSVYRNPFEVFSYNFIHIVNFPQTLGFSGFGQ
jgi:hypothetical protein